MAFYAVCWQETGEEGILHPNPGETVEQLVDRVPEEWRFRHIEKDYATRQAELRASLIAKHGDDEDYDVDQHMEDLADRQERYDEEWR